MGVAGPWYERLPHFRMGFTPSSGKELQSEYFVPRRNAVDAIVAVERLRDHVSPHLMITELRTIDGGRPVDEPVLQAAQPRDPLHMEAGLGGGEQGAADDRAGAGAVRACGRTGASCSRFRRRSCSAATRDATSSSGSSRSTTRRGSSATRFWNRRCTSDGSGRTEVRPHVHSRRISAPCRSASGSNRLLPACRRPVLAKHFVEPHCRLAPVHVRVFHESHGR